MTVRRAVSFNALALAAVGGMLAVAATPVAASIVWSGATYTYTHAGFTDPTKPINQDRITTDVWITRGTIRGIYNAASESSYTHDVSPAGTEWAFGTTANYDTLTYAPWEITVNDNPPSAVGIPMVMHLIADDIYLDITFLSWGMGSSGGAFSYIRAEAPVPAPGAAALLGLGGLAMAYRRRR